MDRNYYKLGMPLFVVVVLVPLFLLDQVTTVTAVTGCQAGRDKDHRLQMSCTAAGLDSVPVVFEAKTQVLLFPRNQFDSLPWTSFNIYRGIHEIDLTGNKVPALTPSDSPILPTLSILRLGSNRLTSLLDHSFSACPALTEVHLQNNSITYLSDHSFSGLSKLQILDLSSNLIKVLPGHMLHPLSAIETLYIKNNQITLLPDGWFSMKEDIPFLFLSANPWDCTCSNLYLQTYILDYELNFYVQHGAVISSGAANVVCASPPQHQDTPVMNLEESDLCPPVEERRGDLLGPITEAPYETTTPEIQRPLTTTPPTTTASSTSTSRQVEEQPLKEQCACFPGRC